MYIGMSSEIAADTIVAGYMIVLVQQRHKSMFSQ